VHSGALASFAPYGQPNAHRAPNGLTLLEDQPAVVELGVRWRDAILHAARPALRVIGGVVTGMSCLQPLAAAPPNATAPAEADWRARWEDAVLHAVRPGFGVTGWIMTAMSCLQPLAAALPAPSGTLPVPFAITRTRAGDGLHPVWDVLVAEPEPDPEPTPSRWMARPLVPARLADQWLGLSAASEFVSSLQWPQFRPAPEHPEFALFAACKPLPGALQARPHPICAVQDTPLAFDRLVTDFNPLLTARSPQPAMTACAPGLPWRHQTLANSPGLAADDPMRWVRLDCSARAPALGKLSKAGWTSLPSSAAAGSAGAKTKLEAMHWRYEVRRSSGKPLHAVAPDWNLLMPPVVEAAVPVIPEVAAIVAPPAPSTSVSIPNFPVWTRRLAFHLIWILPLALGAVWFGPAIKASSSGALPAQWAAAKAAIQQRATIDLEDDFRGGLNHWSGADGWAKSWSYDATGLLHPGTLSLYLESAGMGDYSVEFLGVIEKRGLGWTYRTADLRNYYAARLALTRRGNIPTLDLERYAVIDGRQDRRVQLPLPVVLSNILRFACEPKCKGRASRPISTARLSTRGATTASRAEALVFLPSRTRWWDCNGCG
jgi:hypothetical protein